MHHPTLNFSGTYRSPTPKCYTFLETSHDRRLGSKLRCTKFEKNFATLFCNQTLLSLLGDLPPSVILFWKPLMTTDLDPKSDAKILHIFCNPFLQTNLINSKLQLLSTFKFSPFSLDQVDSSLVFLKT